MMSTSDIGHGAGIAAFRLHTSLLEAGVDSKMLVAQKKSDNENVFQLVPNPKTKLEKIAWYMTHGVEYALNTMGPQTLFSLNGRALKKNPYYKDADILHFHNIHWTINNFSLLSLISKKKPVIWTLHDMWPITGHCFYSQGCERWRSGCGKCSNLDILVKLKFDTTHYQWLMKKHIYTKTKPVIVTPSKWLAGVVKDNSILSRCDTHVIPCGMNQKIFFPRHNAKEYFGLDPDKNVLFFIASALHEKRKGYQYFEAAVNRIKNKIPNLVLLVAGDSQEIKSLETVVPVIKTGYIDHFEKLAMAYSAADVFVLPSIQDNLPNVVLESLACGTSVVGFNIGGLPDMVTHLKTGYLAENQNSHDLVEGILTMFKKIHKDKSTMEKFCLDSINRRFTEQMYSAKYIDLYKKSTPK